jgi:hypothetical protein
MGTAKVGWVVLMDLSICVVSFNTRSLLERALETALADSQWMRHEAVVVDNASSDGSADMVREVFPGVRLVENRQNRYFTAAANQAFAEARGTHLLLLNPDTEIMPGTIQPLVAKLLDEPEIAAATPRMMFPDGRLQRNCSRFPSYEYLLLTYTFVGLLAPWRRRAVHDRIWFGQWDRLSARFVEVMPGSFMLIRRAAFEAIGPFDEKMSLSFSDTDWCRRAGDAGFKLAYLPVGGVVHQEGASRRQVLRRAQSLYFRDLWAFAAKWYGRGRAGLLAGLTLPTEAWQAVRAGLGPVR